MRASAALLLALAVAGAASAAPPRAGLVVAGRSLGGLQLGATPARVRDAWGHRYGVCRDCREPTWYFNYRPFEPQGSAVSFRKGRAVALFTLWSPQGWRTDRGLAIGDTAASLPGIYGVLLSVTCGRYSASLLRRGTTTTAIYVVDGQVWGFGLLAPAEPVCR